MQGDKHQSGFTRTCLSTARAAWSAAGRVLSSYSKAGRRGHESRAALNLGMLLLLPLFTLVLWFFQAVLLVVVAAPIAGFALLMTVLGGIGALIDGSARRQPVRLTTAPPPPPPPPPTY